MSSVQVDHFRTDDGCRIAYRIDGAKSGPVLMLSNSLGTDMEMWSPQIAAFARRFRVLRYDSRGHGRSDAPPGSYSMDRLGRDALQLLDHLDVSSANFCGLSKGGMIGQWLGFRAPERIERLVLANTSAYMGPPANWQSRIDAVLKDGMAQLADASIQRWFTSDFIGRDAAAVEPIRRTLIACRPHGYAGCCAAIRDMDLRPTVSSIVAKVLVLSGTQDRSTTVEDGRWLASAVRNGRLATLEAAHLSNVEQPQAFAEIALRFLCDLD